MTLKTLPVLQDAESLADAIMERVENIIPILPAALVATVFSKNLDKTLNELELKNQIFELLERLEANGHRAYIPRSDVDYAITVGVRMFTLRHVLHENSEGLRVNNRELPLLRYYANSIKHQIDAIDPINE